MKEHPILFTPANAQLVFDRLKTQTRRVVQAPGWAIEGDCELEIDEYGKPICIAAVSGCFAEIPCPFGVVGDRLWVREAWRTWEEPKNCYDGILYKADNSFRKIEPTREAAEKWVIAHDNGRHGEKWRHARFMFRWCSRTLLEITDIRVERLQDISEKDARAEGIFVFPLQSADDPSAWWQSAPGVHQDRTARGSYAQLWDSINDKTHPWKNNDWIWAITFQKLDTK